MREPMKRIWLVGFALLAGGCCCLLGPACNDGPTKKPVATADIVGTWEAKPLQGTLPRSRWNLVTFELKDDGTFVETITYPAPAAPEVYTDKWELSGSDLRMKILRPGAKGAPGTPDDALWDIIDSGVKGQKFGIYGSLDETDPDYFFEFKKVR
jgi:hypothetical protein